VPVEYGVRGLFASTLTVQELKWTGHVLSEIMGYTQTQTYEIVLRLRSLPGGMNVLPGMSVTVMPFAAMQAPDDATVSIPLTAIASDARDGSFVWVVGEDGRVARRAVVTGDVHGGSITISSGLRANERTLPPVSARCARA
jgi:hypothetical protein